MMDFTVPKPLHALQSQIRSIFADMRAFRIYDGPSEVHRWSLAIRILKGNRTKETTP